MGFETLCFALFENRDLVSAISKKLIDIYEKSLKRFIDYDKVKLIWGSDDMDFMCRGTESNIRERVRFTLEECMPGGGYCLGTGNSVANFLPLDNFLVMLDEGRKFNIK